jgi:hypothetical protein
MIINAILEINPNAKVSVRGSDIDTCEIEWTDGTTPISKTEIKNKMAEMPTEEEKKIATANAKTSAINKLKGATYSALTDVEIKALFGDN